MTAARTAALAWGAFAVCCAVWSSTFLFIRMGESGLAPVWAATLRLILGGVLLALLAFAVRAPWPRGATLRAALWFGVIDFGISLPLLYWGELQVPSGVAAVTFATIPFATTLTAAAFGLERLQSRTVAASLLALAGVALLASAQMRGAISPLAFMAVLFAALTAALAGVMLKRAPHGHPLAMNAIAHLSGAVLALPISFALREAHRLPHGAGEWGPLLYLTIVGSIVAFVSFMFLIQHWSATRTGFITVVTPVLAMLLGVFVLHERFDRLSLAGAAVVIAAVLLGLWQPGARAAASAEPGA